MSLYVERFGQGEPLVLLHGWGLNGSVWHPVVQRLKDVYEIIVIDLPGHGRSRGNNNDFTLASLSNVVVSAVPGKAHWLGWSLGGLIAQYIAIHSPERVSKLVLAASNAQYVRSETWPYAMHPEVLAQFEQGLSKDYKATLKRFLAIQTLGAEGARALVKELSAHLEVHGYPEIQALQSGLKILESESLVNQLSAIQSLCLLLFGRLDTLAPPAAAQKMMELIPNAQLKIFEHAAHAPFISHPEEFCAELNSFLREK